MFYQVSGPPLALLTPKIKHHNIFLLFLILEEEFSGFFFTIEYDFKSGLVIYYPWYVEVHSFYSYIFGNFYDKKVLNFVCHMFLYVSWYDPMIFILHSINVVYHIYWFAYVKLSLNLRVKSCLIMVYSFLNVPLKSVY